MYFRQLLVAVIALLVSATPSYADQYFGVFPGAAVSDVRNLFPNAEFEELKPAWLKPYQRLVQIRGEGIDGVIAFLFEDELSVAKRESARLTEKKDRGERLSEEEKYILRSYEETIGKYLSEPNTEPWKVDDIRWQPNTPIALSKLITRYGKPDKEEIREDMQRVKIWKTRGITAFIEDNDIVGLIVYRFTFRDWVCASRWKRGDMCDPQDPFPELRKYENQDGSKAPSRNQEETRVK